MEYVEELKPGGLKDFISVLKKAKILGSSLLWYNDIIVPYSKNEKIKGEHFVKNPMDDLGDRNIVLITEDIGNVIKEIDEIKGRKTSILYRRTDQGIIISINDIDVIVAVQHYEEVEELKTFEEHIDGEWIEFSNSFFENIRDNELLNINGPDNLVIRVAKSVIPSIGAQQKAWEIKYTGRYKITSGNKRNLYIFSIYMTFESTEIVHRYKVVSYRPNATV